MILSCATGLYVKEQALVQNLVPHPVHTLLVVLALEGKKIRAYTHYDSVMIRFFANFILNTDKQVDFACKQGRTTYVI